MATQLDIIKEKLERGEQIDSSDGWVLWYAIEDAKRDERKKAARDRAEELKRLFDAKLLSPLP